MRKLNIKNGIIFDPLNGIKGEVKDILIENGLIVEKFSNENNIKIINASNKTIIPAALDIHAHGASQQVNWARLIGVNNSIFQDYWKGLTLDYIAKSYIKNGYAFILEANVFPSLASQTLFNLRHIPTLDKGMLLNVSNLWALELEFLKSKINDLNVFISDLLYKTKGFGLKIYNPFESENWNFKSLRHDLSQNGRLYNFNILDIFKNLIKVNESLRLPHSVQAHIEGSETEQAKINLLKILKLVNSLEFNLNEGGLNGARTQSFHLSHASSYNMDGDNHDLINHINSSQKIDLDLGFVTFNVINPLISSDRRLIFTEQKENRLNKMIRSAVEFEGDFFATLRRFDKNNARHCIMWSNAMNLALNIKNKWQIQLSLNYPNYGDINDIPKVATWLMSPDARNKFMDDLALPNGILEDTDNSLSFNEFIIISRASPAKSLGLNKIKGNLGPGADADLNILDVNINELDSSKDYNQIEAALKRMDYVIKTGKIVKMQELIDLSIEGKIFWSQGKYNDDNASSFINKKKEFYAKFYSVFYESLESSTNLKLLKEIKNHN